MNQATREALFEQYKNMIYKIIYENAVRNNIDPQELIGEGYLIFEEALRTFNASKSSFCTHLNINLKYRIRNHINRNVFNKNPIPSYDNQTLDFLTPHSNNTSDECLIDQVSNLSESTQKIVEIILESNLDENTAKKTNITKLLRSKNVPWNKIWKAYKEMKALIRR